MVKMLKVLAALLVGAFALGAAQGPAPQRPGQIAPAATPVGDPNTKGTAIIRGRILLGDGRPARRAAVRLLHPGDSAPRVVSADLSGRYEFTEVAEGEYRVSAGKPGYLGLEYGQRRSPEPGTLLTIKAGETLERIDVTLPASGAISGRVVDENGDPVEGVAVTLLQTVFAANRRQLVPVPGVGGRATDDQGRYRLYAVTPGQYILSARPADSPLPPGYASTYFPGAANASGAKPVTVGVSQEAAGADIALARVATARVSGVVVDSTGKPTMARVSLIPASRAGGSVTEWISRVSDPDGRFEIASVYPGEWVLQAAAVQLFSSRPQQEGEFVSQLVPVNGDGLRDIHLQLSAGSHVAGRVVFDGIGSMDPTAVPIGTLPADADRTPFMSGVVALPNGVVTGTPASVTSAPATATAKVQPDGTFQLDGVNGPRRFRLARLPASWSVKAIRANGRDVTDEPLSFGRKDESLTDVEIVLTNHAASVGGVVSDARGQPVAGCAVLVFATDPDRWYQGSRFLIVTRTKSDGSFAAAGLPPGEYHVAAVSWMQGNDSYGEWQDPAFLTSIAPRATRVLLADGQAMSVTPRPIVR